MGTVTPSRQSCGVTPRSGGNLQVTETSRVVTGTRLPSENPHWTGTLDAAGQPLAADTQGPSGTSSTDPVTWDRPGKVGVRPTEGHPRPGDAGDLTTAPHPSQGPTTSFPVTDRWEGVPRPVPSRPPHPPHPPTTSRETSRRGSFPGKGKLHFFRFFFNKPTVQ